MTVNTNVARKRGWEEEHCRLEEQTAKLNRFELKQYRKTEKRYSVSTSKIKHTAKKKMGTPILYYNPQRLLHSIVTTHPTFIGTVVLVIHTYWENAHNVVVVESLSRVRLSQPHRPARLLCPWDSPGKNTGVDCHFLLQVIVPTQESNPGLLHCRQILYWLS